MQVVSRLARSNGTVCNGAWVRTVAASDNSKASVVKAVRCEYIRMFLRGRPSGALSSHDTRRHKEFRNNLGPNSDRLPNPRKPSPVLRQLARERAPPVFRVRQRLQ